MLNYTVRNKRKHELQHTLQVHKLTAVIVKYYFIHASKHVMVQMGSVHELLGTEGILI